MNWMSRSPESPGSGHAGALIGAPFRSPAAHTGIPFASVSPLSVSSGVRLRPSVGHT